MVIGTLPLNPLYMGACYFSTQFYYMTDPCTGLPRSLGLLIRLQPTFPGLIALLGAEICLLFGNTQEAQDIFIVDFFLLLWRFVSHQMLCHQTRRLKCIVRTIIVSVGIHAPKHCLRCHIRLRAAFQHVLPVDEGCTGADINEHFGGSGPVSAFFRELLNLPYTAIHSSVHGHDTWARANLRLSIDRRTSNSVGLL